MAMFIFNLRERSDSYRSGSIIHPPVSLHRSIPNDDLTFVEGRH